MDAALRGLAVFLEVLILAGVLYCLLSGLRLIALDLGMSSRYSKPVVLLLTASGVMLVVFFASHLSVFYPTY